MSDTSILILSCDSYEDIWRPFFILKERYWKFCPYETYIATESKNCLYAESLKHTGAWTKRIRESLQDIPTKYVLILCEDFFIRERVDDVRIGRCIDNMTDDIATFSFEKEYDPTLPCEFDGFRLKPNKSRYLNSCQTSLWDREKLIERLQEDTSAWGWEYTTVDSPYKHYVNSSDFIIDYGYKHYGDWFGIRKGKWVQEDVIPLFEKEGIEMDFAIRGFYEN